MHFADSVIVMLFLVGSTAAGQNSGPSQTNLVWVIAVLAPRQQCTRRYFIGIDWGSGATDSSLPCHHRIVSKHERAGQLKICGSTHSRAAVQDIAVIPMLELAFAGGSPVWGNESSSLHRRVYCVGTTRRVLAAVAQIVLPPLQ